MLTELVAPRVAVRWSELDEVDVGAAIRLAGAEDLALAHVYVDLRGAPLLVYIGDRGHVRVLIRRVALPASFDEAAREEVGAIVSSALDALCAGGTIGIVRAQALPTPDPPPPPRSPPAPRVAPPKPAPARPGAPPRRWSVGVLAGYRLIGWAPSRLQHALELGALLRRHRGRVDPQASAWLGVLPPIAWSADSPRIGGATLRAELAAVVRLAPRWSTLVAAAGGLELLRAAGDRARLAALPVVQAGLGLRAALGRGVVAELRGHVTVDLVDTRVIDAADGRLLFDPWRVRPGVSLAFGWASAR